MISKEEKILNKLIQAKNETEVSEIIENDDIFKDENWSPYGGYTGNFNTFYNQMASPIAALVEKPINSIDSILLKECKLRGINPKGEDAPKSMQDAIEKFFGVPMGDFSDVITKKRRELSKNIRLIAEGGLDEPNIIITDFGEGQHPLDFKGTFLSLHRDNKIDVPFVQGKWNMGGTGAIRYCGENNYQLILSRKTPELLNGKEDLWGFTLVRLHPGSFDRQSWYEYLVNYEDNILSFEGRPLKILPEGESLEYGCYIKLFNYKLKKPWSVVLDLWRDLNRFLYLPALPVEVYEARDIKGLHGRSRVLLGNKTRILIDERGKVELSTTIEAELDVLGKRKIEVTVFKEGTSKSEYTTPKDSIFFTINGQAHATLGRSFIKTRARLHYLADYLLVNVDCSDVQIPVRVKVFMASRDRFSEDPVVDKIKNSLAYELRKHKGLKELNQYRYEQQTTENPKDDTFMEKVLTNFIKENDEFVKLLGIGGKIRYKKKPGPVELEKYDGKEFPTFLKILKWDSNKGTFGKKVPINSFSLMKFETDVSNDYFDRRVDSGGFILEPDLSKSVHLWNGIITIRICPRESDKIGDVIPCEAILSRRYDEPLKVSFEIEFVEPIEKESQESDRTERKPKGAAFALPKRTLVYENQIEGASTWSEMDPEWNREDVAEVKPVPIENGEEDIEVFINMDSTVLRSFLRRKQLSQTQSEFIIRSYQTAIFLYSLVQYNELRDFENRDDILPIVMKGVSKIILDLIWNEKLRVLKYN